MDESNPEVQRLLAQQELLAKVTRPYFHSEISLVA
jgi:hypothetical protein